MARTITVTLTVPQAQALWYAARYMLELPEEGDGPDPALARAMKNGQDKIAAALNTRAAAAARKAAQ